MWVIFQMYSVFAQEIVFPVKSKQTVLDVLLCGFPKGSFVSFLKLPTASYSGLVR